MRYLLILLFSCFIGQAQIVDRFTPFATGFHADYQAVLDEGTTQGYTLPSGAEQITQNAIVQALDDAGVWVDIDVFLYFKDSGDSDFKNMNWKAPTTITATETGAGSLTYSSTGVLGDGTNYLVINWNPTDDTSNYALSDAGLYWELITAGAAEEIISADYPVTGRSVQVRSQSTFHYLNSNGTGSRDIVNFTGLGHHGFSLTGSTTIDGSTDGTVTDTASVTPDFIPSADFELLRVSSTVGDSEIGYFIAGGYINHTTIYNIMN